MDGQNPWLIILSILGAFSAIPVLFQVIKKLWNFLYVTLSFKNLKIRAIGRTSYGGIPHITLKIALSGKEDVIIDEVVI